MAEFDPNAIGVANGSYFALPVSLDDAEIVLLSVPWDATVSYGSGASMGPKSILDASLQVDLFDEKVPEAWKVAIGTVPVGKKIYTVNEKARKVAEKVISSLETGASEDELSKFTDNVNSASQAMNDYVECSAEKYLRDGKKVAVIGGEHSVPFGLIKALSGFHDDFGILHIDAHADLRKAYEGFKYSHASIMYNVLEQIPQVSRIVQVGVRDYCSAESKIMTEDPRVVPFTDGANKTALFEGQTWKSLCGRIIDALPDKVYVSFDIDGLSPEYCPSTGTPVPGGLSFSEAEYLIYQLAVSGKEIIGFDLCEVAPSGNDEWDANVGARMLFKLALFTHINIKK